ncbi:DNA-binding SARP family transcriptional activator/tetratricopeptide (TPR) repeat protein [Kitasatospora sp. MAA19]|uniref:AfsR/SARP family transcriptional regulator n=1 Tax=Kitasatospora sp. MAA19 TaxID=3035090 RepID=UPI002473CCA7|nr:tetratricopeptide repeat protein [Kitasatospora sp. MAA19]MDH6703893.1 DNA-binding SARP family transcriptional activator/tetratricopeptide (TPR) repeat protein [Kitasatospora sp. MAA19]
MQFHLLGSVELSVNGEPLAIHSDKRRQLLAALALEVGRPLSHASLVYRLWDEEPPPSALTSLYSHVSHLRALLRRAARTPGAHTAGDAPAISTRSHTYTLRADPHLIDWHQYLDLSRQARLLTENRQDHQARTVLSRAMELWRGEPLAGLPGQWARNTRTLMADQHLTTRLLRIEVDLRLGRHPALVPELTALHEERPTDERIASHLMTALYAVGRQADALAVYPAVVRRLRARLATEPGEPLTRLHHLMLRGEPLPDSAGRTEAAPPPEPAASRVAPAHLPGRHQLIGRREDLRRVLPYSDNGPSSGGVVTVSAILGMPGVGKTTLALHAADLMRGHFPDGYVYLNLRAHVGSQLPFSPEGAGTVLLRRLGVPATTIPLDADEIFTLCTEALSSRRAVVILDDASSAAQIRPLLPPAPAALIIVTSRQRLAELPGARPVFLDVLPVDDAVALFTSVVGPERANDRGNIVEIVNRCGLLPLAIELAASRFKARPSWTLDHLARRLARRTGRLAEIHNGTDSIARAFEVSYQYLSASQRSAFRLLGLYPGPDFGLHAAAALLGRPLDETDQVLEALLNGNLLQEIAPERYQLHDLLREFAVALGSEEEQRVAAIRRMLHYTLQAADLADRVLYPHRSRIPLPENDQLDHPADLLVDLELNSLDLARSWFEDEHASLVAMVTCAHRTGLPEIGAWLSHVLAGHLDAEAYWSEARDMHQAAAAFWRSRANDRHEARALIDLGATLANASHYPPAVEALERGLALARSEGDADATADALGFLGRLLWNQSQLYESLALQEEVLSIRRETGDQWNAARCLANIGIVHRSMGDIELALTAYENALPLARKFNDRIFELRILNNIGDLHLTSGNSAAARDTFERILHIGRGSISQFDLSVVHVNLAATLRIPEELDYALTLYRSALETFRSVGSVRYEADALNGLGTTFLAAGRHQDARDQYAVARELARSIGTAREEAAALRGLGQCEEALGHTDAAIEHLAAAIELAEQVHIADEASRARTVLAELQARST